MCAYHNECRNASDIHPLLSKRHNTGQSGIKTDIPSKSKLQTYGMSSQISCQSSDVSVMSKAEKENANKILLLQFIQKGFSISPEELAKIQSSDPEIKRLVKQNKDNKFEIHKNDINNTIRMCLVIPEYIAKLVLRDLHVVKMPHLSSKQMARMFAFTFFTRHLSKHSQDVSEECLHCTCNFLKRKNSSHLGEQKLFPMLLPNQV